MKHSNSNIPEFKNIEENFLSRIRKMKTKLAVAFQGFDAIRKIVISQIFGSISLCSVHTDGSIFSYKKCSNRAFSFPWKNKKDKMKRTVMYQPLAEGVLNFVNFFAVVKSLRLAWISRLLSSTTDSWNSWNYFNTYGGLKFLLKCKYNAASINNGLSTFYRELLQYFQEFKD